VEYSCAKCTLEVTATEAYKAELKKKKQGLPTLSSQAICERFMEDHKKKLGKSSSSLILLFSAMQKVGQLVHKQMRPGHG